jgi:DNA-binding transcriptional regulator YiaG
MPRARSGFQSSPLGNRTEKHEKSFAGRYTKGMISLTEARDRLGLTQAVFAGLCGTSQAAVAAYEAGRRTPTGQAASLYRAIEAAEQIETTRIDVGSGRHSILPTDVWTPAVPLDAEVVLPTRLDWSPRATAAWRLADPAVRESFYALILDEGNIVDICVYLHPAEIVRMGDSLPVSRASRPAVDRLIERLQPKGERAA